LNRKLDLHEKLALSIAEACALAGVNKDTLYREMNSGRLQSAKINRRRVIRRPALDQWLADRESATTEAMGFKGDDR
jgi:excisionase family DNA binding protein